jgi:hypothetical protein
MSTRSPSFNTVRSHAKDATGLSLQELVRSLVSGGGISQKADSGSLDDSKQFEIRMKSPDNMLAAPQHLPDETVTLEAVPEKVKTQNSTPEVITPNRLILEAKRSYGQK